MTNQEAADLIRRAITEIEWTQPMEYAAAFDKAIEALEEREALHMLGLNKNTLVIRSRVSMKPDKLAREKECVIKQVENDSGVIILPNIFDVMYVPEGTTVRIEECMR